MVVLLNPVCALPFGMVHVYNSEVRVAVFRRDNFQNIGFDRPKIVEFF